MEGRDWGMSLFISIVGQIIEGHVSYTVLILCYYVDLISLAFC